MGIVKIDLQLGDPLMEGYETSMLPFEDVVALSQADVGKGFYLNPTTHKVGRAKTNVFAGVYTGNGNGKEWQFVTKGLVPVKLVAGTTITTINTYLSATATGEFGIAVAGDIVVAFAKSFNTTSTNGSEAAAVEILTPAQFLMLTAGGTQSAPPSGMDSLADDDNPEGGA